jgi:hypothetical protein
MCCGARRRAEFYFRQLDALRALRQQARRELLEESKKHKAEICDAQVVTRRFQELHRSSIVPYFEE